MLRLRSPWGRVTPGALMALTLLGGGGYFLTKSGTERTTVTCGALNKVAQWVKSTQADQNQWDDRIRELADSVTTKCPEVMNEQVSPTVDGLLTKTKEGTGVAVHRTVGTAKQLVDNRKIDDVLDGRTVRVRGVGDAHLLGITVPPETGDLAKEYLRKNCLGKSLSVQVFPEKDAESYPLVVLFAEHGPDIDLAPELAINGRMVRQQLALPWAIEVGTDNWSNRRGAPKPPAKEK